LNTLASPPPVALIVDIELEIRKAATPAPTMHISSCGSATSTTAILPPEMMKLPNTMAKSSTMPMIWNKALQLPHAVWSARTVIVGVNV
jgi:hypothetical protein